MLFDVKMDLGSFHTGDGGFLMIMASYRKNYSQEAANLLAMLTADFSPMIGYIVTHNRTVNITYPGKGKVIDMAIEHHTLVIKNA